MAINYNYSGGDGKSAATAAPSATAIKIHHPASGDGFYWVVNPNVNSGNPFQVYCDMTTDGGGWMLIMQNSAIAGTELGSSNGLLYNQLSPPLARSRADVSTSYSILSWADNFKNPSKPFQYMIEGYERNRFGGIWIANNPSYSFVQTTNTATDITLKIKFGNYSYPNNSGIEAIMPWVSGSSAGYLTTSASSGSSWWGTLIEGNVPGSYSPAPYLSDGISGDTIADNPGVIWYWMRNF